MKQTQLLLKGAACSSCRFAIEQYSRKMKEIAEVSMDPGTGTLTITHDGSSIPAPKVQELVRKLGYEAVLLH